MIELWLLWTPLTGNLCAGRVAFHKPTHSMSAALSAHWLRPERRAEGLSIEGKNRTRINHSRILMILSYGTRAQVP
ncbi:hypothetical protein HOY80DRAFT_948613 [Tuber brumale]|nr:hypothetical protein HOY80DRAFT_948613 [Tuber brumale]